MSSSIASAFSRMSFWLSTDADGVHFERPVTLGEAGDHHVFQNREIAKDLRRLEHAADPHLVDLVRRAPQNGLPVEHHRTGVGDQFADEAVQQGGLARAVGADDRVDRVFLDAEVHLRKSLQPAEPFTYVFYF